MIGDMYQDHFVQNCIRNREDGDENAISVWLSMLHSLDHDRLRIERSLLSIAESRRILEFADRALDWRGVVQDSVGWPAPGEGRHAPARKQSAGA